MSRHNPVKNQVKAWLSEFLFTREHFTGPTGKPLFSYHVTSEEFNSLETLLSSTPPSRYQNSYDHHWAAAFCLFVAEWYRREYDKDWSWTEPERRVGRDFNNSQHDALITGGLVGFWKRPIRQKGRGRDLLGSLFAEGGLPWQLVQSETHGFGRAIRKGLRNFYRTRTGLRSTADLLEESLESLPIAFRNLETRQMLAGIVEQLMYLAEQYPLKGKSDPALYLDQQNPGWKDAFPIPLDESNARQLINEWLKDADQRRQERKKAEELASAFCCEHQLHGFERDWSITTELTLPKRTDIPKIENLSTTRLELGFYEGDTLIARGGAVYAQISHDHLGIRFPETNIALKRRDIESPVSLRLLENGQPIHSFYFDGSVIEKTQAPMFFERREDDWYLVSQASYGIQGQDAKIRLPANARIVKGETTPLVSESSGARWLKANSDVSICIGSDIYNLRLNCGYQASLKPALTGALSLYDTRESAVFMGFPTLSLPEDYPYNHDELQCFINGRQSPLKQQTTNKAGIFHVSIKHKLGDVLLRRRIGVLPDGFSIALFPAGHGKPARIKIRNGKNLLIQVVSEDLISQETYGESDRWMTLEYRSPEAPTMFRMEVSSDASTEPVTLILPYPYQGGRVLGENGETLKLTEMTVNDLLGVQLALFSGQSQGQIFHLRLELQNLAVTAGHNHQATSHDEEPVLPIRRAYRYYRIAVGEDPKLLSLFSYQNDIVQLLGSVNSQDAYVRFTLESSQRLLTLNIRRYSGYANKETSRVFSINTMNGIRPLHTMLDVRAMQLASPENPPVVVAEKVSDATMKEPLANTSGTGVFEIPELMSENGPWLLYPATESAFQFRPFIHVTPTSDIDAQDDTECSLHQAAQNYHPKFNPDVIHKQIAMMAEDFDHSGWQYLADLKSNYGHLPLSVFESWQALAANPNALAAAIFRLEIDERFCNRLRDELAVIWESIELSTWHKTYTRFSNWLTAQGLPEALVESLKANRTNILHTTISGFEHLGHYISSGDIHSLPPIPPLEYVLPAWYQDLRLIHQSDSDWPEELGNEFRSWVKLQDLPDTVKQLSLVYFSNAVVYLPIFMAFVTAGKASLEDLEEDTAYLKFVIRMISDFDRGNWYTPVHSMMVAYLLKNSAM